jgi:hypothetical protein
MQSDYTTGDPTGAIAMLLPWMILQVIYAAIVFQLSKKQNWNPWLWTIVTLVPILGAFVFFGIFVTTLLKTLDRLNVLEKEVVPSRFE